jgi:hypothetical protein
MAPRWPHAESARHDVVGGAPARSTLGKPTRAWPGFQAARIDSRRRMDVLDPSRDSLHARCSAGRYRLGR